MILHSTHSRSNMCIESLTIGDQWPLKHALYFSPLFIAITNMGQCIRGGTSVIIVGHGMVIKFEKHFPCYHLACHDKHCCHIKNQCSIRLINCIKCIAIGTKHGIRNETYSIFIICVAYTRL